MMELWAVLLITLFGFLLGGALGVIFCNVFLPYAIVGACAVWGIPVCVCACGDAW